MTLAELLDNEETTSAAEESSESTPKYIPDGDVDKLASSIEEFANKFEDALEKLDNLTKKARSQKPPSLRQVEKKIRRTKEDIVAAKRFHEYEALQKRLQAVREGKFFGAHPWVVPAVLGALGGAYLWNTATKSSPEQTYQNQMMGRVS